MSVNQQQHPMPKRLQFTAHTRGTTRFAALSTLGLVIVIVGVTALLARGGGTPSNSTPLQSLGALAAQDESTPEAVRSPTAELAASVAWELDPPLTHSGQEGKIVVSEDRAFQLVTFDSDDDTFDFSGVRAVDLDSGNVLWQQELEWSRAGLKADSHGVYSVASLETIDARDPDTGDSLWTLDISVPIASIALDNGVLYVWDADSQMSAINVTTGKSIWRTDSVSDAAYKTTQDGVPFSLGLEIGGDAVIAMDADSTLHAFNLTNGGEKWTLPGFDWQTTIIYSSGDTLLAVLRIPRDESAAETRTSSPNQHAMAIDMHTGATSWEVDAISPYGWSGSLRGDNKFYVVAASLEGATANSESSTDALSSIVWPEWTPTAAERQNLFDGSPHVFALDAATGEIDWQQSTGAGDFYGLGGATSTGVWAVTVDQQVVLLSAETGALVTAPVPLQRQSVNGLVGGPTDDWLVVSGRGGKLIGIRTDPI